MLNYTKKFWLFLIIFVGLSLFVSGAVLSASSNLNLSLSGDDARQNGGVDDPYDALIILDLNYSGGGFQDYVLEYSTDNQNFQSITAQYKSEGLKHRQYYWSTSRLPDGTIYLRVKATLTSGSSDWTNITPVISHQRSNLSANYFVEHFINRDYYNAGGSVSADWNTDLALAQPLNLSNGTVVKSRNLSDSGQQVLRATFQPIAENFSGTIKYRLSNDGVNWYGDTSGIRTASKWFVFDKNYPDPVTVPFNSSTGTGLYWSAYLQSNGTQLPQIYKIKFQWEENSKPVACFTSTPRRSALTNTNFHFDAKCSSDYEDQASAMQYRWDFGQVTPTTWTSWSSSLSTDHVYNSTSTFNVTLEVKDTEGAIDSVTDAINLTGLEDDIWGWSWSSNYGWTSLNCNNDFYGITENRCSRSFPYAFKYHGDGTMSGWAWNSNLGWVCLGSSCTSLGNAPDGTTPVARYFSDSKVVGWAKYLAFETTGWLKLQGGWCNTDPKLCAHLDFKNSGLNGFAWSGGTDENGAQAGVGWDKFLGYFNAPWLETRYASVYSQKNLGSASSIGAPPNRYNSTYCLWSGGLIINFKNQTCEIPENLRAPYRDLGFIKSSLGYRTANGVLPMSKLISKAQAYQNTNLSEVFASGKPLAGKIYYFNGSPEYLIDQPITFGNGRGSASSGAGTIIINGNLRIKANTYFEDNQVSGRIKNLASVGIIVLGDVIIEPNVDQVAGNLIVLGNTQNLDCQNPDPSAPSGCGALFTGDDSLQGQSNSRQLTVYGIAVARKFILQRTYKLNHQAAEVFIYDGRVLVNTPPGFEDVSKSLPRWQEALPNRTLSD